MVVAVVFGLAANLFVDPILLFFVPSLGLIALVMALIVCLLLTANESLRVGAAVSILVLLVAIVMYLHNWFTFSREVDEALEGVSNSLKEM